MNPIIIYATHPNLKTAKKIIRALLSRRLIACANLFPVHSTYRWKNKIVNSKEIVSIIKTKSVNWSKVKSEITKLHPYETPCIIKINAEANKGFADWINEEVKK
ncbi:MAG: divalent-cation tolerance protein CutA [Patescibacteria group bacterium]